MLNFSCSYPYLSLRARVQNDKQSTESFQSVHAKKFLYLCGRQLCCVIFEVRKVLYQKGYICIVMRGGITGLIQASDTDLQCYLKEMTLMLKMSKVNKTKSPPYNREDN